MSTFSLSPEELNNIILAGEGPTVEFKERFTPDIAREIAAFANAGGGLLLLGVADDSTVVGVDEPLRAVEERIMNLCRNNIKPPVTPQVEEVALGEGRVVVIRVPEGAQKPYTANDICYVRAGSTTRRARPEELRALSFEYEYTRYERTIAEGLTFEDINLARLQDYIEQRAPGSIRINGLRPVDVAVSWGLAVRKGETALPTVAGALLFGFHPQRMHPHWGIGAVKLAGSELASSIMDRADIEGPVDVMVDEAVAFVKRNMRVRTVFPPGETKRVDVPEYPLAAVREAITNAVVHRDYSLTGRVMIRIFEDRLEVQNPGGLVGDLTLEEVEKGGFSYPRNPIIARVMRDWGRMEEVGRGLVRIRKEMEALGSPPPIFESTKREFRVVLYSSIH